MLSAPERAMDVDGRLSSGIRANQLTRSAPSRSRRAPQPLRMALDVNCMINFRFWGLGLFPSHRYPPFARSPCDRRRHLTIDPFVRLLLPLASIRAFVHFPLISTSWMNHAHAHTHTRKALFVNRLCFVLFTTRRRG